MRKVLITDGSSELRKQLVLLFTQLKFDEIYEAATGNEAIQLFALHRPDIMTIDSHLANQEGVKTIAYLVLQYPDAKIIAISSIGAEENVLAAIRAGASSFLIKPVQIMHLVKQVFKLLKEVAVIENGSIVNRESSDLKGSLILAIDHSKEFLHHISLQMNQYGYRMMVSESILQGFDLAKRGNPDLLLIDLEMPDRAGYELIKLFKSEPGTSTTPIIIVTSQQSVTNITSALKYGIVDYFSKKSDPVIIEKKISTALIYSSYLKEERYTEGERYVITARRSNRTIIILHIDLDSKKARIELKNSISDTFRRMAAHDRIIIDIHELSALSHLEIGLLVDFINSFKPQQLFLIAGRHYGAIVSDCELPEHCQLFVSRGDVEVWFKNLDEERK